MSDAYTFFRDIDQYHTYDLSILNERREKTPKLLYSKIKSLQA